MYTLEQAKSFSDEKLKAMAYDCLSVMEAQQANLKAINAILRERNQPNGSEVEKVAAEPVTSSQRPTAYDIGSPYIPENRR